VADHRDPQASAAGGDGACHRRRTARGQRRARIVFHVDSSCIASGRIEVRAQGSGASWRSLAAVVGNHQLSAQIPQDLEDAREPLEVRAVVTDCEG
jgi:hypothetical protein